MTDGVVLRRHQRGLRRWCLTVRVGWGGTGSGLEPRSRLPLYPSGVSGYREPQMLLESGVSYSHLS